MQPPNPDPQDEQTTFVIVFVVLIAAIYAMQIYLKTFLAPQ
jgi:hypothetical protein